MRDFEESQPFVDHIFSEHRRLAQLLIQVQSLFVESSVPQRQGKLLDGLQALKKELANHFREEEEGGCLDEAVAHCPGLGAEADAIIKEHADLLTRIGEVVDKLAKHTGAEGCEEAATDFHVLVEHILNHEARENKVMAKAFGTALANENGGACRPNWRRAKKGECHDENNSTGASGFSGGHCGSVVDSKHSGPKYG